MTTHELAHGIRALEQEIGYRSRYGLPGLLALARAAGAMRRELAARGRDALAAVTP